MGLISDPQKYEKWTAKAKKKSLPAVNFARYVRIFFPGSGGVFSAPLNGPCKPHLSGYAGSSYIHNLSPFGPIEKFSNTGIIPDMTIATIMTLSLNWTKQVSDDAIRGSY